jgi:hypothetical protein
MRSKNLKSEGYDPAMLKRIHNEIYCADVEELERMIDRDLSAWK